MSQGTRAADSRAAIAADSICTFLHDDSMNRLDIRMITEQCCPALGDHIQANQEVGRIGGPMQDPEDVDFVALLLDELEPLDRLIAGQSQGLLRGTPRAVRVLRRQPPCQTRRDRG